MSIVDDGTRKKRPSTLGVRTLFESCREVLVQDVGEHEVDTDVREEDDGKTDKSIDDHLLSGLHALLIATGGEHTNTTCDDEGNRNCAEDGRESGDCLTDRILDRTRSSGRDRWDLRPELGKCPLKGRHPQCADGTELEGKISYGVHRWGVGKKVNTARSC